MGQRHFVPNFNRHEALHVVLAKRLTPLEVVISEPCISRT